MRLSRVNQARLISSVMVFTAALVTTSGCALIAGTEAKRIDVTPPTFAGLKSATTCIPGPIGGGRTTRYHLGWGPARDGVPPGRKKAYDISPGPPRGGENISRAPST